MNQIKGSIEPIEKRIEVPMSPDDAFTEFTDYIIDWWPLDSRSVIEASAGCVFETEPGGRIFEAGHGGEVAEWGIVDEAERPNKVRFRWFPGRSVSTSQSVEVTFESVVAGGENRTAVRLVHSGFESLGADASSQRASYYSGWDYVLGVRYLESCLARIEDKTFADSQYDRSNRFREHGFLLGRSLISADEAASLRQDVAELLGGEIDSTGVSVFDSSVTPASLRSFCTTGAIKSVLFEILGSEVEFLSVKPVLKTGSIRRASPWHQDWTYWKGSNKISAWVALDRAAPANGCLRVVPGSHTEEWHHDLHGDDGFVHRIAEKTIEDRLGAGSIRSVPMNPGDVLFFHDLLLHGSRANPSGKDRWSLIPTYRSIGNDPHELSGLWREPIRL